MDSTILSRRSFVGGAAVVAATCCFTPYLAYAETSAEKFAEADAVREQLVGLQYELEVAANQYYAAIEEQEAAKANMEAEQVKIDEASARIDDLQDRLGNRARSMYRSGSLSALDFLLGSSTFEEFTTNWGLLVRMNQADSELVSETKTAREDLQAAKDEYARQEQIAEEKAAEAVRIKEETEVKIAEATELVNTLDAEAQALLEAEQAAEAARIAAEQEAARQAAEEEERRRRAEEGGYYDGGGDYGGDDGGGWAPGPYYPVPEWGTVVDYAYSRIGCPYVWGGEGPDGFDCSGLVRWCYLQVGMSLPHYTESLYACATNIVSVAEARPGDVLYRYGHVGIAAGYGGVPYVHAPTFGAYVRDTDSLSWSGFTAALQFG